MTEAKEVVVVTNGEENNKKEESLKEEVSELESSIIRQIEYYFSDRNLPRDMFLRRQLKLDEGWLPLEILTRFNRLAKFTKDTKLMAKALNKSTSGLLEMSEDNKKVRRRPNVPIPDMNEERRKELSNRTLYAKGFPEEATLDDLLDYFEKYEHIENIIMRMTQERFCKKSMFKGSVFITFKTREQAEKFMEAKPHKYLDTELMVLWSYGDFIAVKQENYVNKKEKGAMRIQHCY